MVATCPCQDEKPKICPLCGADAETDACRLDAIGQEAANRIERLRALLWVSWFELNTIRARDGAPQHIDWNRGAPMQTNGVDPEYFSAIVDALSDELGDDTNPWPVDYMKPHLVAAKLRRE